MSDVVAYDTVSEGFGISLNGMSDITEVITGYSLFNAFIEAFFRYRE